MFRTVTRNVLTRDGGTETVRFGFDGVTSGEASLAADRAKFNIEHDRGLHNGTGKYESLGLNGEGEEIKMVL